MNQSMLMNIALIGGSLQPLCMLNIYSVRTAVLYSTFEVFILGSRKGPDLLFEQRRGKVEMIQPAT